MKTNRLAKKMNAVKKQRSKVFCAFLTLGYPNLATTKKLIIEMEKAGVDIIELGFPFSDPLADGPTIQYSSEQVLKKGVVIEDAFRLVKDIRKKGVQIPIVFFTYLNPIFHYGFNKFVTKAKQSGFDGLIVPDLPPEEEKGLQAQCRRHGLSQIFLVAPTTQAKRASAISRSSNGFIYYVSLRGVTGVRRQLPSDVRKSLSRVRRQMKHPVLIGFGVSSPQQGKSLSKMSDGVIVGSAIVDKIRKSRGKIEPTLRFIRSMVKSVKESR